MTNHIYPIFLQFEATKTWYKITNDHSFIEVKILGGSYSISEYSDDILPMRNHISDLLEHDGTKQISELDYQNYLDHLKLEKIFKEF